MANFTSSRFALLTVDTEALPRRASGQHVKRLIWGEHLNGSAGIRDLAAIGNEFNIKHVFFVDMCSSYPYFDELRDVVRWLDRAGQDVQLHMHPEILPEKFWTDNGLASQPTLMNEFPTDARAAFVIDHFGKLITDITGKNLLAFRAGSFRWNASTIKALRLLGIPLSFNNSMRACLAGQCGFSETTNLPYAWSNRIIEVPLTEKRIPARPGGQAFWASLTYPESPYFPFQTDRRKFLQSVFDRTPDFKVLLLHSWSLLNFDENGHAYYKDDRRLEGYRKLLSKLTKDYDVITTSDFLDLYERGKIPITRTVDLSLAELKR